MAVEIRSHGVSTPASSSSVVITKPSGLAVGDLMVAHIATYTDPTVTNSSGFTTILSTAVSEGVRSHLAWKIATSGDVAASNFTFTLSDTVVSMGAIIAFTGHDATTPIGASNGSANGTDTTTISAAAITPPVADSMILFFSASRGSITTTPYVSGHSIPTSNPTWTELYDTTTTIGSDLNHTLAYGIRTATTSTGTGTATQASSRKNCGQLVAISPAADAGEVASIPLAEITTSGATPSAIKTDNKWLSIPLAQTSLTGFAPTVRLATRLSIPLAQITTSGAAPTANLSDNKKAEVPLAEIQTSGVAPTISFTDDKWLNIQLGEIQVTAFAPSINAGNNITAEIPRAQIELAGLAPTANFTDDKWLDIPTAQINLTGIAPAVRIAEFLSIPRAQMTLQGFAPMIVTGGPQVASIPLAQMQIGVFGPAVILPSTGNSGLTMMGIGT